MPDESPALDAPPADAPPAPDDKPKRAPAGGWAYLGPGYTPGVPARDLTAEDLDALEAEGWDLPAILATGAYRASPSAAKALADKE